MDAVEKLEDLALKDDRELIALNLDNKSSVDDEKRKTSSNENLKKEDHNGHLLKHRYLLQHQIGQFLF